MFFTLKPRSKYLLRSGMHSWRAVWFRSSLGYRKWRWSALQLRCAKTVHKVGDTNKTWGDLFGKKSKEEWKKIASVPRNEALGDQRSWGANRNRKGRRNPWAYRFVLFLFVRSKQAFESRTEDAYHIKMDWERMRKIVWTNKREMFVFYVTDESLLIRFRTL